MSTSQCTRPRALRPSARGLLLAFLVAACGRAELDPYPAASGGGVDGGGGNVSAGGGGNGPSGGGGNGGSGAMGGEGGSGGSQPCEVAQQCDDFDPCTTNLCNGGECSFPLRDDDQDGSVSVACGGLDCNDFNPEVFPGHPEDCNDGSDNDCNGVDDCFDPACAFVPDCGCDPSPESCTNGQDDDCDELADCFDADCQGTPACGCLASENGLCFNGFDDDCDDAFDCEDSDCASQPACECQNNFESCFGGTDDDCDLLIDCADPDCAGVFPCACVPPGQPENCSDGQDNDCDTLPDCADADCFASPACQMCEPEVCDDGQDNDCDLKIDCADEACLFSPGCDPVPEICNNGLDDDGDSLADCQDPDCANTPLCQAEQANCLSPKLITGSGTHTGDTFGHINETEGTCGGQAGEAVFYIVLDQPSFVHLDSIGTQFDSVLYVRTGACNTGLEIDCDDDSGGNLAADLTFNILYPGTYYIFLDGYTVDASGGPNEGPFTLNVEIIENPPEICGDGIDNDGDVFVDCADSDCTFVGNCINCNGGQPPQPEFAPGRCTDGQDNDCDGSIDCGDDDCSASPIYITECCNGLDETQNGVIDDFNCRCATTADCQLDHICYDHTVRTCGPPCTNFFGDVCPNIQPGSFCNPGTGQCEFP
ncbi:MAG: hypothetical protein HOW73_49705 [Polyangiaceae bacterium]|nr:hypothetical protein [Polyangiaceae bacterium]